MSVIHLELDWSQQQQFSSHFCNKIAQIQAEILKNTCFLHCRLCFNSALFDFLEIKIENWSRHLQFSSQICSNSTRNSQKRMFFALQIVLQFSIFCFSANMLNIEVDVCNFLHNFLTNWHKFKQNRSKTSVFALKILL